MQKINQSKTYLIAALSLILFYCAQSTSAQTLMRSYGIEKSDDWVCKVYNGPLQVRHYMLKNGLTVIFSKNPTNPKVATRIAIKAGSKNDPSTNTGLAHYLEHMLFKGTDKYGTFDFSKEQVYLKQIENLYEKYNSTKDTTARKKIYGDIDSISGLASQYSIANEYDKMVQAIGATGTNAYTSVEQTVYVNTIPHNEIHRWLEIEAERFRHPVMRLFHTELEAVYEEKNISMDNDYSKVFETMNASLFKKHNYGLQTTIGTVEHLKNPSLVKINEYYQTYYVPNNMAIIMAGDFGYDSTIKMIVEHFSSMKPKPVPEYKFPIEYPSAQPKTFTITGKTEPSTWIGFRLPGFGTKEAMMSELVDMLLNNSQAGLFDLNLVKGQKVLRAATYLNDMKDYSVHYLYGSPKKGQSLTEVQTLLMGELEKIKKGQFSDTLLKSIILDYTISKMKSSESNQGRITDLTSAFIYDLEWTSYHNRLYHQSRMTKAELVKFANEFYTNDHTVIYKEQGAGEKLPSIPKPKITPVQLNRDKTSDFVTNIMQEETSPIQPQFVDVNKAIKKGITGKAPLWYVQNTTNELFSLYYVLDMGKYHDKILPLAVNYIQYVGAEGKNASDIAKAFYNLGSSFSVSTGNDQSYVYLNGIQKNFSASVQLFENLLRNPLANKAALNNMIKDMKTERANSKSDKRAIASGLRSYALYGKDNPFNYELSDAELDKITAEQLITYIKKLLNYKHTVMYYGPAKYESIQADISALHASPAEWQPTLTKKTFTPLEGKKTNVYFAQYDDMIQAQISWVKRSNLFDVDQMAMSSLHREYFGGGMSGVVFQTIRESKSLAYSSYSVFSTSNEKEKYNTVFSFIGTQSDKMKEAIIALNELHQKLPVAEGNFDRAKMAVISKMNTQRTTKSGLFWFNRSLMEMGLDSNYQASKYANVSATTMDDLISFHKKTYSETPFNYAILGDKSKLDMVYLKTLGPIVEVNLQTLFGY